MTHAGGYDLLLKPEDSNRMIADNQLRPAVYVR